MSDTSKLPEGVTVEWRVTWFDPSRPEQMKAFSDERAARDFYDGAAAVRYAPILEERTITVEDRLLATSTRGASS